MTTMAELDRRVTQHDEDVRAIFKELRGHTRQFAELERNVGWLMTAMVDFMTSAGVEAPPFPDASGEEE